MSPDRDEPERRDGERELAVSAGGGVQIDAAGEQATPDGPGEEEPLRETSGRTLGGRELLLSLLFLVPALVLLGAWVLYPVFFTVWRSFFDSAGDTFIGVDNYREMFTRDSTRTAIRNNVVWVIAAPTLATGIGLVFAVLTERIKFGTAFKIVIFMPMAISFLAAGVIFRFVYDENPNRGLANALLTTVTDVWQSPGAYPGARPADTDLYAADGDAYVSTRPFQPGDRVLVGILAVRPGEVPEQAVQAQPPAPPPTDGLSGTVWLDFTPRGGERGVIDPDERGLPRMRVQALDADGRVVGSARAGDDGRFVIEDLPPGSYTLRLPASNFAQPWTGLSWLGPSLVTPAVIGSFLWIWTGFAMMVIAAGLAAIPRETMEAARVDGANEWQVFRRVTIPLLWPVIMVVVVTLVINVLKIFDLVLVIPPGAAQADANVIALELWRVSFGGARDQGLGSALGVLLFALVIPAMLFNIRRFRAEEQ